MMLPSFARFFTCTIVFLFTSFISFKMYQRNKALQFPDSATVLIPGFFIANIFSYFVYIYPQIGSAHAFVFGYPLQFYSLGSWIGPGLNGWVLITDILLILGIGYFLGRKIENNSIHPLNFSELKINLSLIKFACSISIALDIGLIYFLYGETNMLYPDTVSFFIEKSGAILVNILIWGFTWRVNELIFRALYGKRQSLFVSPHKGALNGFIFGSISGLVAGWFSGIFSIDYFRMPNWSLVCVLFAGILTGGLGWLLGSVYQDADFSSS